MMRLIDDDHIPPGSSSQVAELFIMRQELHADNSELIVLKWIGRLAKRLKVLWGEKPEKKVESAQELNEPLMKKRLGYTDKASPHSAGKSHSMQDKAGFDGLTEPRFVGEKHAHTASR
jgi:hypothetical protein